MVPKEGFEPPTYGLQNRCTTPVLFGLGCKGWSRTTCLQVMSLARYRFSTLLQIWWTLSDSNRSPPACKAGALPDELRALNSLTAESSSAYDSSIQRDHA